MIGHSFVWFITKFQVNSYINEFFYQNRFGKGEPILDDIELHSKNLRTALGIRRKSVCKDYNGDCLIQDVQVNGS